MTDERSLDEAMGMGPDEIQQLRGRVDDAAAPAETCPHCGTTTRPHRGHRTLCFDCTMAELNELHGETWDAMKARTRVTEKKAAKRMAGGRVDQVNLG
jgi:ribosomal protein L32